MFISRFTLLVVSLPLLSACASAPKAPDWTKASTRTVDNGFIVYVGQGSASNTERAQFLAEGLALEDLANECSVIPKGARVEDRFIEPGEHETTAFVKVAVEFQDCDQGRFANTPEQIQKVASRPFTEQLKRYQDLSETGVLPDSDEGTTVEPPSEIAAEPTPDPGWSESTRFYVTRQYVAYQKEIVVLAPSNAYAANSPETKQFLANVPLSSERVIRQEHAHPELRGQAWSRLPNRPAVMRPASLKARPSASARIHPPRTPGPAKNSHRHSGRRRRGRHRLH